MFTNPQLELAYDFVCHTDKNIFLTGKAGTGKTTFLHRIKKEVSKRLAVVAPTGVAAINAGGMTIHSLFQLPFGPIVPGAKVDGRQRRFNKKKITLLRSLDLLIIDEISMVRADVLDGIDEVLRRYRRNSAPFGGVQLLMIGDLNQLPPVVKPEEWSILAPYYRTAYFFGSLALQKSLPISIELKYIYRQSDEKFIGLLNKVRDNQLDQSVLSCLNGRYQKNFEPLDGQGYITLTSHNAVAQKINQERLLALEGEGKKFKARIEGEFPVHAYPTNEEMELKIGAQIMFVKNDPNPEKLFFNGKIGQVVRFGKDAIYVKCPDDAEEIAVTSLEWSNTKYELNEETKEVESKTLGSFNQYPLKLAWAITIHKSQGLTFERAIIDAESAFAHGQVYVALSRCKSFEGIVLRSKITFSSVKTDQVVKTYNRELEKNAPDEKALQTSKKEYQHKLILELFDFSDIQRSIGLLNRVLFEYANSFQGGAYSQLNLIKEKSDSLIFSVAKSFAFQLRNYLSQDSMPESNQALQGRIKKASAYFVQKMEREITPLVKRISFVTDNQTALKKAREKLDELQQLIFIKITCLKSVQKGFEAKTYVRSRANADLEITKKKKSAPRTSTGLAKAIPHFDLYEILNMWRQDKAAEKDISPYEVITIGSILEVTRHLPTNLDSLKRIKGIGEIKLTNYGNEILEILNQYVQDKNISSDQLDDNSGPALAKGDTKRISFDLFLGGNSIDEIAQKRGLVRGTIEGHLLYFIQHKKLEVEKLISPENVKEISAFYQSNDERSTVLAKQHFGDKYTFNEIRMVLASLD